MPNLGSCLCLIAITLTLSVATAARYEDCEIAPSVPNSQVELVDNEDTVNAIYTCNQGYELQGEQELICDLDTDEWNADPPQCVKVASNEVVNETPSSGEASRKKKPQDVPEEPNVSAAMAATLDMSCVQAKVKAPEIRHGYVQKYDRRRNGDKIFLVAYYACNERYEFEDSEINALYCSKQQWVGELPGCMSLGEYNEEDEGEYDEYDAVDEEDDEDTADERAAANVPQQPPPPPPAQPADNVHRDDELSNEINAEHDEQQASEIEQEPERIDSRSNAVETEQVTDINIVVPPTQDPYTPRILDNDCGVDKGGCEQKCERLLFPGENEPRLKCSCYEGFSLDPYDYVSCHDIDECQLQNGGCEQICNNIPGSYQCACEQGLQIDSLTGHTCIDINECELASVIEECGGACENTHGSYKCIQPLNEPVATECDDGYRLSENGQECIDIDECSEGLTNCEQCLNLRGSYECVCPSGFSLAADGSTCRDINECEIVYEDDSENGGIPFKLCSNGCINTIGSYSCTCGPQQHLAADQRTCLADTCADLNNPHLNKTRCAHQCVDASVEGGLYECICPEGYQLNADRHNCDVVQSICAEAGGYESCTPGTCVANAENTQFSCACPAGYETVDNECLDIDECARGLDECSHECFNNAGSYRCGCPAGYQFAQGSERTCVDIDECASGPCGTMNCVNLPGAFECLCNDGSEPNPETGLCAVYDACAANQCSHKCIVEDQQPKCICPAEMQLDVDGVSCVYANPCAADNNGCQHYCDAERGGVCSCERGFALAGDGKSCFDIDECADNNGNCHQVCENQEGGYKCSCLPGFEFLDGALSAYCFDIDECILGVHNCSVGMTCENLNGSYTCLCPAGYALGLAATFTKSLSTINIITSTPTPIHIANHSSSTSSSIATTSSPFSPIFSSECLDIDECSLANGNCSHFCFNFAGGYACGCPPGYKLSTSDSHTCLVENLCLLENGGCAQFCDYNAALHTVKCRCRPGFALALDGRQCEDVNECALANGLCEHDCLNALGSYDCQCREGFELSPNGRNCLDIDECAHGYGNCSYICINLLGSYACACEVGYTLAADQRTCVDIDECAVGKSYCSHECVNLDGSYECRCPSGFELSSDNRNCVDINECLTKNGGCADICQNSVGSYECRCSNGQQLLADGHSCSTQCTSGFAPSDLDASQCVDINECAVPGICEYECINRNGSYECRCPAGYVLRNGKDCIDIDECQDNNGGCRGAGKCINHNGGHECRCDLGYRLAEDQRTCERQATELRDNCKPFVPPLNGEIHCNKYRHKKRLYYHTRCKVWCNDGYRLEGPPQRYCSASGEWDDYENKCVPIVCPRLPQPANGQMFPANCALGNTYMGERCRLQCNPGYLPVGKTVAVCTNGGIWSHNGTFDCQSALAQTPAVSMLPNVFGQRTVPLTPQQFRPATVFGTLNTQRPYIRCPRNTTVLLKPGERTAHIILQKPITNLDVRFIEAHPAWAKDLQAHLAAGRHVITFRGHDRLSGRRAKCRTVINVRAAAAAPQLSYCTPSFEVTLAESQAYRSVVWEEPRFQGNVQKLYKSRLPGELFGIGTHTVFYEATNEDGLSARCEFKVTVKPAAPAQLNVMPSIDLSYSNAPLRSAALPSAQLLAGHESYVVCPGKPAIKVTNTQSVELPVGCVLKNIRASPLRQYMQRRLMFSPWASLTAF